MFLMFVDSQSLGWSDIYHYYLALGKAADNKCQFDESIPSVTASTHDLLESTQGKVPNHESAERNNKTRENR